MTNLEELCLYLSIYVREIFIDGDNLKKNILNHMSQLNKFSFHIHSTMFINDGMNLSTKHNNQQTFKGFKDSQVISYIDYFVKRREGQCHIYSCPFLMKYYDDITNSFPGGVYPYVRVVSLYDEQPFEHEFFIRIHKSFPFIEKLTLINHHKQYYKPIDHSQNSSIVKYCYLIDLNIKQAHDDYIEEFLCDTKTFLCNNIHLTIDCKTLLRVTYNCTRDDMRNNCAKIQKLCLFRKENCFIKSLQDFFPFAKIY